MKRPQALVPDLVQVRWHTAVHEAGHAVIGRVLGMLCGPASVKMDHDSAGHSIAAGPWAVAGRWEAAGKQRKMSSIWRGRIMSFQAGAELDFIEKCAGSSADEAVKDWLVTEHLIGTLEGEPEVVRSHRTCANGPSCRTSRTARSDLIGGSA